MGQAKQRGTYEDRMMAARVRIDDIEGKREEHLRILSKIEADTSAEALEGAKRLITDFVDYQDKVRARSIGMRIGGNRNGKTSTGE